LTLALRAKGEEGHSLPSVFDQLEKVGAHFRRGQLSMIAGAPGGGKSAVASHLATWMAYDEGEKVPTLYFSADSDKGTLGIRLAAGILNKTLEDTEALLEEGDPEAWAALNSGFEHVWLNWDPAPTFQHIEQEIEAYVAVTGEYPHLIVIDNLKNMVSDSGGAAHEQYDQAMEWLKILASVTKAHVLVLHHVTGSYEAGDEPIPLPGLLGKPGKACRLILTLYMVDREAGLMGVCVVKNSNGKADASGNFQVHIPWMPSRSFFADGHRRH
jgi:replicative DNA helicase